MLSQVQSFLDVSAVIHLLALPDVSAVKPQLVLNGERDRVAKRKCVTRELFIFVYESYIEGNLIDWSLITGAVCDMPDQGQRKRVINLKKDDVRVNHLYQ